MSSVIELQKNSRRHLGLEIVNWSSLPDELLLIILSYLDFHDRKLTLPLVCQRWAKLSLDFISLTAYSIKGEQLTSNEILQILRNAPNLKSLEISGRADINTFLKEVGRHNIKLRKLKLVNSFGSFLRRNISAVFLNFVISRCTLIEALSIEDSPCRSVKLWTFLPQYLPNLRKISYVGKIHLGKAILLRTILNCKKLESIKILTCDCFLEDNDVKVICETIGLRLVRFKTCSQCLTDMAVLYLINCKRLKAIHLKNTVPISSAAFQMFSTLSNLHSLGLTHDIMRVWSEFFQPWMKQLRKLNLQSTSITDADLRKIAMYCVSLEKLSIRSCEYITANGLEDILKHCNRLKILNVFGTRMCTLRSILNNLDILSMKTCRLQEILLCPSERMSKRLLSAMIDDAKREIGNCNPYIKLTTDV